MQILNHRCSLHLFHAVSANPSWGRGVQRIVDACEKAGNPKPKVAYDPSDLWFEFPYSADYLRIIATPAEPVGQPASTTQETTPKTTQKTTQKALAILADEPTASRHRIAERLGDITADGVKYQLARLKRLGRIRRLGPDKGGHWDILK